jgi:hypothetical protein
LSLISHRNAQRSPSTAFSRAGGRSRAPMEKVGRASSTAFRRTTRPPADSRTAAQPDRYLSTFAISGENWAILSFFDERGSPRYVCGNPSPTSSF